MVTRPQSVGGSLLKSNKNKFFCEQCFTLVFKAKYRGRVINDTWKLKNQMNMCWLDYQRRDQKTFVVSFHTYSSVKPKIAEMYYDLKCLAILELIST